MVKNLGIRLHAALLFAIAWFCDTAELFLYRTVRFQPRLYAQQIGTNNNTTPVQGAKLLSNLNSTRQKLQVIPGEIDINADIAPMTMLLSKLGANRTVRQATYYWIERDAFPRTITTNATQVTSGAFDIQAATTAITCAAGTGAAVIIGQLLLVERTGEMMRVTNRVTDELTVSRGYAGTSAAIIAGSSAVEEIRLCSIASAENSTAPNGRSIEPKMVQAYPQTFRSAIEASRREMNSENYGDSDEWKRMVRDALEDIHSQKEAAYMMSLGANTSDPTSTKGLEGYLFTGTNVRNQAGTLDEASLETVSTNVYRRNNGNKSKLYTFAGENFATALDGFARDYLRLVSDDTKLGLKVQAWQSSFGEFKMLVHPQLGPLSESVTAANRGGIGKAFFVNLGLCGEVHFKGGELTLDPHVEVPGTDGRKDVWTEDGGFMLQSEKQHAEIYGITG